MESNTRAGEAGAALCAGGLTDEKIKAIRGHVRQYAVADDRKAWATLATTALGNVALVAMYLAGWGWAAMLFGAGLMVRIFIIYHDAIHRAFFKSPVWNDRLAMVLQLWTLTPAKLWRKNHLAHHGRFGDLGFRDVADTVFLTKQQFEAMPSAQRRFWRAVRSPLPFFLLLPIAQWGVEYPFLAGNLWIWSGIALQGTFVWQVSLWHLGAAYLGMLAGLILFHLQHGVNRGYRAPTEQWRFEHAALLGSTWVRIPWPFTWFTLGIEYHHIHHLHAGVPCYALARCNAEAPAGMWDEVTVGTWRNCLPALRNVMWDSERNLLVPFGK